MKTTILSFLILLIMTTTACTQTLETVPEVDLNRYSGLWHEIARMPSRFEKGCFNVTANYQPTEKGTIQVINSCDKGTDRKGRTSIEGKAFVVKNSNNAKLKVQFFWPFRGDYWIIGLADDYNWALVGSPSRKYLWVLSRTKEMDTALYQSILLKAENMGFNTTLLENPMQ